MMDNTPEPERNGRRDGESDPANGGVDRGDGGFEDDEAALRDVEVGQVNEGNGSETREEEEADLDVMEAFATQTQVMPPDVPDEDEDEPMVEVDPDESPLQTIDGGGGDGSGSGDVLAPPVFRPTEFSIQEENLARSVKKRLRKGHEAVLEEQPKWSLLAKVLKEIEDTIARVSETHAGE